MNGSAHSELVFFVRDDGAGFEKACDEKPSGAFQRLQGADEL